jgi:hypothetical protein
MSGYPSQALVSFKKYMPPPLPYFKVNICPFPLPHFASIFFAYLWSFRWPNYIVTLPRYFSFRLPHLNISTGPPWGEVGKGKRADVYLEVRKRRGHIFFECDKCLWPKCLWSAAKEGLQSYCNSRCVKSIWMGFFFIITPSINQMRITTNFKDLKISNILVFWGFQSPIKKNFC